MADYDVIVRNGTVVDGTGADRVVADVAVVGDRVVAVERALGGTATRTIDATDKLVTPGFVDIHTHLDRSYLAELMESVEDIPRDAIMTGLPWDWVTYGEYLDSIERMPKGLNVGGMIGHCALRQYAMGERGLGKEPATADDLATMCDLLDEALRAGALGFSTSRTYLHKVPDGRPVPGTYATTDELFAFADVLGRHGAGVFESASRIGRR